MQNDALGSSLNDVTVLEGRGKVFCGHSNKKRDDEVGVSKNVRNCVTLFKDDVFSVSPTQPVNKPRSNGQLVCHMLYVVCYWDQRKSTVEKAARRALMKLPYDGNN